MTAIATLSQGGTSVEIPLLGEGGNILSAVDLGKPDLIVHDEGGSPFPRVQDQWSGFGQFNINGVFRGPTAYSDVIELVELLLSDGDGETMTLDIPDLPELDSNIPVAPSAEADRALNLNYQPGRTEHVEIDLGLTRIGQTLGGYNRTITTPTASGSGPIELSDGVTTVQLINDIVVDRYVGRPNDVVRKSQGTFPRYEIKPKVVNDEFELSLIYTDDVATKTSQIASLFKQPLGRTGLELRFNGTYGLGTFDVIPSGSGALRHVREAGKEDVSIIPTVNLRRITT